MNIESVNGPKITIAVMVTVALSIVGGLGAFYALAGDVQEMQATMPLIQKMQEAEMRHQTERYEDMKERTDKLDAQQGEIQKMLQQVIRQTSDGR
jgi:uncharacterized protein HemX